VKIPVCYCSSPEECKFSGLSIDSSYTRKKGLRLIIVKTKGPEFRVFYTPFEAADLAPSSVEDICNGDKNKTEKLTKSIWVKVLGESRVFDSLEDARNEANYLAKFLNTSSPTEELDCPEIEFPHWTVEEAMDISHSLGYSDTALFSSQGESNEISPTQ